MAVSSHSSVITLNVNGLYSSIKRHRMAHRLKKTTTKNKTSICCLQDTHFKPKDTHRLKAKKWKMIFQTNGNQKRARVVTLISDKINFKTKIVIGDKEGHYIMIKESIQLKDIIFVNISALNIGTPKYIGKILIDLKGERDSNTIIEGKINNSL